MKSNELGLQILAHSIDFGEAAGDENDDRLERQGRRQDHHRHVDAIW